MRTEACVSYSTGWEDRMERAALTSSENRLSCLYFSDKKKPISSRTEQKPAGNQCDPPSCCHR